LKEARMADNQKLQKRKWTWVDWIPSIIEAVGYFLCGLIG
jgi:hypothetical protein